MPAALVDRILGRRKVRIGQGADGDGHETPLVTLGGMIQAGPADRAEAEPEPGSLVASPDIVGGLPRHLVAGGKCGERGKDAARPALAGQAVADPHAERLPFTSMHNWPQNRKPFGNP